MKQTRGLYWALFDSLTDSHFPGQVGPLPAVEMASGDASFEVLADVGSNLLIDKSLRLILVPVNFDRDKNRWNLYTGKFC